MGMHFRPLWCVISVRLGKTPPIVPESYTEIRSKMNVDHGYFKLNYCNTNIYVNENDLEHTPGHVILWQIVLFSAIRCNF